MWIVYDWAATLSFATKILFKSLVKDWWRFLSKNSADLHKVDAAKGNRRIVRNAHCTSGSWPPNISLFTLINSFLLSWQRGASFFKMHLQVIECVCDDGCFNFKLNSSKELRLFKFWSPKSVTNKNICCYWPKYLWATFKVAFQLNLISRLFDQQNSPGFLNVYKSDELKVCIFLLVLES